MLPCSRAQLSHPLTFALKYSQGPIIQCLSQPLSIIIIMKSYSTTQQIEFEAPEEDELVPHVASRTHKVFANNPTCNKKRVFIDLTDDDPPPLKPLKKCSSNSKKADPFEKLGQDVYLQVSQDMKDYSSKCKVVYPKNSLEEYNQNVKELISRYLLFGLEELIINKIEHPFNNLTREQRLRQIFKLAITIQVTASYHHGKNLKAYQSRCKMIVNNLKDFANRELRQKVLDGRITPEMMSLCQQSDLDSYERKLANHEKVKYLLAEADVVMKGQLYQGVQQQVVMEQSKLSGASRAMSKYQQGKQVLIGEIEKSLEKTPRGFYEKIRADLPEDLVVHFEKQLNTLQL